MKKYKKLRLSLILLLVTLIFTPRKIKALEQNSYQLWKQEAIISPSKGQLVPAGEVVVEFKTLIDQTIVVDHYDVYLDSELKKTVSANCSENIEYNGIAFIYL